MLRAFSTNSRPGVSVLMTGGTSSPTYSCLAFPDLLTSTPIYEPDSSVPSPVTVPPEMRGRTTQKRVPSTRYGAACLAISTFTTTPFRSGEKAMLLTRPTSTSLYLILVLPASRPSAVTKVIEISGPLSSIALIASQPPTSTATIGINQTICSVRVDFGATAASGTSGSSGVCGV